MYATNKTARKNRAPQASAVHGRLNKIGLVILIACSTQNTWAVAVDWNAATGDWMAADNWIPAQIPTSADITVIANNGTAIVSTPGAQTLALFLGYKMVGNQILNQSGNLLINQGGTLSSIVRNSSFTIGNAIQNATSSMLTVDGPGSLLKGNGGVLINGNGGISVTNGGHIELSANPILFNGTDTGNVKLTGLNGNSTLTVSGANSIFQVDPSTNPTAALNQIILGSSDASLTPHPGFSTANSAGILTLADHGQVNAADGILFGQINSVSSGVINIGTGGAAGILNTSSIGFGSSNSQGILNLMAMNLPQVA